MSILFQKDWYDENRKPRAIVHSSTKNYSFRRMAVLLRKMGIKNNLFHLCLYDPKLLDVDPHKLDYDNDPDGELRLRVAAECKRNQWYYLREVLRIPVDGSDPIPFKLDRGNLAMSWCYAVHLDYNGTQPRQTGKMQPLHSLIKTPTGWTAMGNIKLGDAVTAADGTTSKVVGVYPQGVKNIYRITFTDGRSTECGEEHLWKVYNRYWSPESTQWRVIDTAQIRDRLLQRPNTEAGLFVPLAKPENKPDIELPLDPYVLGVFLGDGCITGNSTIQLTTPDQFILDEMARLLPEGVSLRFNNRYDYYLVDKYTHISNHKYSAVFRDTLKSLNLYGTYSYSKFIPDIYLEASAAQRLSLLQGLLDTDGTVDHTGSISYCSTSEVMAKQVQYLVRSLGGICKMKTRQTHYTLHGKKLPGRPAYHLAIRIDDPKSMFRLPRQLAKLSDDYKSAGKLKLGIKSVAYVGKQPAQCIEIDHPDHLYVTDDYIVTHNTIGAISLASWTMYLAGWRLSLAMVTHSATLVQANVKRLKGMRDGLPKYLIHADADGLDTDNKQGLDYKSLRTAYETYIGQKDRTAANRVGRGTTAPSIHFDEIGFIPNIRITFPAIMSTTNKARPNAKAAGQPHSNIYTTTAADPQTEEGAYAFELVTMAMPFTEKLYDCVDEAATHVMVKTNSTNGLVNGTFSYLQLGYSHAWFHETIARNNVPPDEVERDYLNHWISAAKYPIVSKALLARMNASKVEPHHCEIYDSYVINWYVPSEVSNSAAFRRSPMVMGMDSSEVIGRDFTTFVAISPKTLQTLFTFRCNDANIAKIGLFVAQLMLDFSRLVLVPERKSTGSSIVDIVIMVLIRERQNPFLRIFNQIVNNKDHKEYEKYNVNDLDLSDTTARKYLGFMTTQTSRDFLYKQVLQRAAELAADRVFDITLVTEIGGLQAVNGRIDHKNGHHDDMCFVGSTLVRTVTGNRPISELKVGDLVLTREGYKPILHVYCHEKEVITKYGLTGTANHPFIGPNGIIEFGDLTDPSEVYVWNEKQSSIRVKRIIDTLNQNEYSTEITFTHMPKTNLPPKLQKEIVYNLCVSECHEYFVNDILVHNCIAWTLACYLILEGKNLHYYGLNPEDLLPNTITSTSGVVDQKHIDNQMRLRRHMEDLDTQMRSATNDAVRAHFRYKLSQLQHYVDSTLHVEPASVDTVRRERVQLKPVSDEPLKHPPISIEELFNVTLF